MSTQENGILYEISDRLARVETKLDAMHQTDKMAHEAYALSQANEKRIDKLDKIVFWAGTTIIGAVIIALLAVVLKY